MQAKFPWVFRMLEEHPEEREWDVELGMPETPPTEAARRAAEVRAWLQKLPLGRRPLVKVTLFATRSLSPTPLPFLSLEILATANRSMHVELSTFA